MHIAYFNTSIRSAIRFLREAQLLDTEIYVSSLPRSQEFNELCLVSQDYLAIYELGLALSHYNFILKDLSYFHCTHTSETEFALAYYPNPRISGCPTALSDYLEIKEQADSGLITDEEFADLAELIPANFYIPRFRFEYSKKQYKPVKHPGAHFHIGMSGEDRWCSSRKLSPLSFAMIIVKYFYPEAWWEGSRFSLDEKEWDNESAIDECFDEKLLNSLRADGISHDLSNYEKSIFHFSAFNSQIA